MNIIFSFHFFLLLSFFCSSSPTILAESVQVKDLIASTIAVESIDGKKYLAVVYENEDKWHTYWKNPGDAGTTFKHLFSQVDSKNEIHLNELEWPIPKRFEQGEDLQGFGYEEKYAFFYLLDQASEQNLERPVLLKAQFLICAHLCIPGELETTFVMKNGRIEILSQNPQTKKTIHVTNLELEYFLNKLPRNYEISSTHNLPQFSLTPNQAEKKITLSVKIPLENVGETPTRENTLIFPFPNSLFTFKRETRTYSPQVMIAKMELDWEGDYQEPVKEFPRDLTNDSINLKFLIFNPQAKSYQIFEHTFNKWGEIQEISSNAQEEALPAQTTTFSDVIFFIFMGVLGGLILNLMPCVLPVVSLKLFSLISLKKMSSKEILHHNLFFSLGIFATLLSFACVIILLRSLGHQVGWGFHLQSPYFVNAMIFILFIFALNLFGLFEFRTPGGNKLSYIDSSNLGNAGEIINGMITTILATPCSAPFLGTALTFAFSHGTYAIFTIFCSISFGLALPFLLTGFFPVLIEFLPRPGAWMEHLKKFLGLGLLLTIVWLFDVYFALLGNDSTLISLTFITIIFVFFSLFFAKFISRKTIFKFPLFLFTLFLFVFLNIKMGEQSLNNSIVSQNKNSKALHWTPWSHQAMEESKSTNRLTFIDFTAKWCLTCKMNEKFVLQTNEFQKIKEEFQLNLLLGDWTKHDEEITKFLKNNSASGVPAYFILTPSGKIIKLSELLSIKEIREALSPK